LGGSSSAPSVGHSTTSIMSRGGKMARGVSNIVLTTSTRGEKRAKRGSTTIVSVSFCVGCILLDKIPSM
jgi:hypothetical protein